MLYNKNIYYIIHHHIPSFIHLFGCCYNDKTMFILQPQFTTFENEMFIDDNNKENKVSHTNVAHKLFTELYENDKYIKSSTNIIQFESCSFITRYCIIS